LFCIGASWQQLLQKTEEYLIKQLPTIGVADEEIKKLIDDAL
jgi:hypothetical protein